MTSLLPYMYFTPIFLPNSYLKKKHGHSEKQLGALDGGERMSQV